MKQHGATLPTIGERPACWAGLYATRIERAQIVTTGYSEAEIAVDQLGPLRVTRLRCGESVIRRGERDIGYVGERAYTFVLQVEGQSSFKHYGHQIALRPGDFTVYDNAAPYSFSLGAGSEVILLRGLVAAVKEHLPTPDFFCGRRLGADQSLASTAGAMLVSIAQQLGEGLSDECRERAARHLLAMVTGSYVAAFDNLISASSIMAGRHWKVKLFIEQHLRDPDLTPSLVADQLKISSRYLRMIFAANAETPSAYILRRRLEECASRLADPRWRGHSITEIAFSWGFNSAPHFTRSFRDRFDVSPRHYRQQHLDEVASIPAVVVAPRRRIVGNAALSAVAA
jgi:AraC family transcriptional activator of tynA and feaB